jgi:prepilin-type N-terminal cleavage/methylation domain-containing protein
VGVNSRGFTFMELLIVLVVTGILAAMAIANYGAVQKRAREASTKSNMHTFQLAAEDYGVRNGGAYPTDADQAAALLTQDGNTFYNPFTQTVGGEQAWVDRPTWARPLTTGSTRAGIVAYGDSAGTRYQIAGRGATEDLKLVITSGQ